MSDTLSPEFLLHVSDLVARLDELDYFQVLNIAPEADGPHIRAAYHQQARRFHPDRYAYLGAERLVADLSRITKRITEAYVVLRDDRKRELYRQNIQGPSRASQLRFREEQEGQLQRHEVERQGQTPQGRQFYGQAVQAYDRGDLAQAVQNLKMALVYERDNALFIETLAQWSQERGARP